MNDQELPQKAIVKWCCPGFEGHYGEAGENGGGILVGLDFEGRPEFTLQFRAVDKEYEQSVSSAIASLEPSIVLVVDIGMRYCPWCGRDLEKWYSGVADLLYRPGLKITC
jgi:hypothetical protein